MSADRNCQVFSQWFALVQSADLPQRCAAILTLGEFTPRPPAAVDALRIALEDPELPVQVAAQIAVGALPMSAQSRRGMVEGLLSMDRPIREEMLERLHWLPEYEANREPGFLIVEETPAPSSRALSGLPADWPAPPARPGRMASAAEKLDIRLVYVLPGWFLVGAAVLCWILAWFLRGVWWSKWAMLGTAATVAILLYYTWTQRFHGSISTERFHARARHAWSAIVATTCGFAVGMVFPLGAITIDNESGKSVRLLLDGAEWVTVRSGESKKMALTTGRYRISVQPIEGHHLLDEHEIEVLRYRKFVLNVLGCQTYFRGTVQYGVAGGGVEIHAITDKWFEMPRVDYLYRDLPARLESIHPVNKTFFTKGKPPALGP